MPVNPMQDALQRTLGQTRPGVSNTMPVAPPAAGPWNRGDIRGTARQGADPSRLGGGFGNVDTDSMKHTFGRIAQNYDTSDAGLQALVQDEEFRRLFPNARLDRDWIDFGGQLDPHTGTQVGRIDVQRGWQQGGRGGPWQWLTEEEAGGGAPQGGGGGGGMGGAQPAAWDQSDLMAQILAALGEQTAIDPQALLQQQLR